MPNTPPFISEVVEEFRKFSRDVFLQVAKPSSGCDFEWATGEFDSFLREKLTAVYERGRQEGREERDKYWLGYIEERAKFELESSVYRIADMLKTDIDVARRKLSALTTEGK